MTYEVLVTSVRDRADLLGRTLRSMLPRLEPLPARILVHEDHRPGVTCPREPTTRTILDGISRDFGVPYLLLERSPGGGLGRAILRLLEAAETDFVFYTQEDFDFLRPVPVGKTIEIMAANGLHHVRFNKRKTEWCKGEDRPEHERFYKREVTFGGQTFCIADQWYFQASIWRRSIALDGFRDLAHGTKLPKPIDRCEAAFNRWLNITHGGDVDLREPYRRGETVRTFIWGPVKEPQFIRHTGGDRRSQGWET